MGVWIDMIGLFLLQMSIGTSFFSFYRSMKVFVQLATLISAQVPGEKLSPPLTSTIELILHLDVNQRKEKKKLMSRHRISKQKSVSIMTVAISYKSMFLRGTNVEVPDLPVPNRGRLSISQHPSFTSVMRFRSRSRLTGIHNRGII